MELVVFQDRMLVQRPVILQKRKPFTIRFDWKNSPKKSAPTLKEYQRQKAQQTPEQFGIISYSGLYSYIYITGEEVRHEILISLLTFEKWRPLKRVNDGFLEVEEQKVAGEEIQEFFSNRNPVVIDVVTVKPLVQHISSLA
ncbi:MAG: hypothetical protein SWO11_21900 [Thermodesulfobacteriota bacterium]|nr:hypothetical protein [Thermodesulfobacteriota bacterium]